MIPWKLPLTRRRSQNYEGYVTGNTSSVVKNGQEVKQINMKGEDYMKKNGKRFK